MSRRRLEPRHLWLAHSADGDTHTYHTYIGSGSGEGKQIPIAENRGLSVFKSEAIPPRYWRGMPRDTPFGRLIFHVSDEGTRKTAKLATHEISGSVGKIADAKSALNDMRERIEQLCVEHLAEEHGVTHVLTTQEGRKCMITPSEMVKRMHGLSSSKKCVGKPTEPRKLGYSLATVLNWIRDKNIPVEQISNISRGKMFSELLHDKKDEGRLAGALHYVQDTYARLDMVRTPPLFGSVAHHLLQLRESQKKTPPEQ